MPLLSRALAPPWDCLPAGLLDAARIPSGRAALNARRALTATDKTSSRSPVQSGRLTLPETLRTQYPHKGSPSRQQPRPLQAT